MMNKGICIWNDNYGQIYLSSNKKNIFEYKINKCKSKYDLLLHALKNSNQLHDKIWKTILLYVADEKEEYENDKIAKYVLETLIDKYQCILFLKLQMEDCDFINEIKARKMQPVIISPFLYASAIKNIYGQKIYDKTYDVVKEKYDNNFIYDFIEINKLTKKEQKIYNLKDKILKILSPHFATVNVFIANRLETNENAKLTLGLCDYNNNCIIIHRSQLESSETYFSTLIHEYAHFITNAEDNTRTFANVLSIFNAILAKYICKTK